MRTRFIECETEEQAKNECPWSSVIAEVVDGYMCFESWDDYNIWENQK